MSYNGFTLEFEIKSDYGNNQINNHMGEIGELLRVACVKDTEHIWGPTTYSYEDIDFKVFVKAKSEFRHKVEIIDTINNVNLFGVRFKMKTERGSFTTLKMDKVTEIGRVAAYLVYTISDGDQSRLIQHSDFNNLVQMIHDNVYEAIFLYNVVGEALTEKVIDIAIKSILNDGKEENRNAG